ncbi:hypothetical protein J6590_042271 [Homalodisca vitripennis]|nr:hypothetical protein J6590_042271 [Homalodisca vitripennis]
MKITRHSQLKQNNYAYLGSLSCWTNYITLSVTIASIILQSTRYQLLKSSKIRGKGGLQTIRHAA